MTDRNAEKVRIALATPADRPSIYRMRHDVYAAELGQHMVQQSAMLSDTLDENNSYIIATVANELAGFISITPPELGRYSIEKYLDRGDLPVRLDLALLTPPWVVGLAAQVAAVRALQDAAYYEEQYTRTDLLGVEVHEALLSMGIREIVPGEANFLMFHLDESQPNASQIIDVARKEGVFVRDIASMGSELG